MSTNLNRKLVLEAPARVADGTGGYTESWNALGDLWAEVAPRRGRVGRSGDLALAEVPTDVTVRGAPVGSLSRPAPGQRFREGDRLWRVLAVAEADPRGRYLRCTTVEEATA